jgi:peptide/nickel transport system substrate-binding protein
VASGWSPVYPCHVPARDMRLKPVGTGPFKFVEFKPNEGIKVTRNPDYWKKDRPYLDGIEYTFVANPSTAILAFASGKFDRYAQGILTLPLMKELKNQEPKAVCEVVPWNIPRQMLVNRDKPPFDNPELRRAMVLTLDRKAFIDITSDGEGSIGGAMMPPPAGSWGMPSEILQTLQGYGPDVQKNRAEARQIMQKLGYGADKRLAVTVTTRKCRGLSRSGDIADRPAEGNLYRRHVERDRHDAMVSNGDAEGLCRRADCQRERAR